jgi:hypothetical protein
MPIPADRRRSHLAREVATLACRACRSTTRWRGCAPRCGPTRCPARRAAAAVRGPRPRRAVDHAARLGLGAQAGRRRGQAGRAARGQGAARGLPPAGHHRRRLGRRRQAGRHAAARRADRRAVDADPRRHLPPLARARARRRRAAAARPRPVHRRRPARSLEGLRRQAAVEPARPPRRARAARADLGRADRPRHRAAARHVQGRRRRRARRRGRPGRPVRGAGLARGPRRRQLLARAVAQRARDPARDRGPDLRRRRLRVDRAQGQRRLAGAVRAGLRPRDLRAEGRRSGAAVLRPRAAARGGAPAAVRARRLVGVDARPAHRCSPAAWWWRC